MRKIALSFAVSLVVLVSVTVVAEETSFWFAPPLLSQIIFPAGGSSEPDQATYELQQLDVASADKSRANASVQKQEFGFASFEARRDRIGSVGNGISSGSGVGANDLAKALGVDSPASPNARNGNKRLVPRAVRTVRPKRLPSRSSKTVRPKRLASRSSRTVRPLVEVPEFSQFEGSPVSQCNPYYARY